MNLETAKIGLKLCFLGLGMASLYQSLTAESNEESFRHRATGLLYLILLTSIDF